MFGEMWKAVEIKAGKIRMVKTKGRRKKKSEIKSKKEKKSKRSKMIEVKKVAKE